MNKKNQREIENLLHWAELSTIYEREQIFSSIDTEAPSYWVQRNESEDYLTEYGFNSLNELEKKLNLIWECDEIMSSIKKSVLIAAIKNEISNDLEQLYTKSSHTDSLSEFIYNF